MDKFTFKTADGVDVNLEKLSQAFPEVITETMGEDGKIKRVADFEKLKMLLGDSAAERPQEFYEFTWPGKNEAIMEAAKATTKTLRPCPEESKNWDTTQNLYIEGDNLEALKILQEAYLGKVKMIYIDPPYNTGKDFVYRDNFHKSAEEGKADETVRDEETDNNLFQNTESNGRFHSDWCSMIYPRLKLARDLLRDDGVIFISIDDNEVHNLRKICDEIFGESNFVGIFTWQKKTQPSFLSPEIATITENILSYKRSTNNLKLKGGFTDNERDGELVNIGNPIVERVLPCKAIEIERGHFNGVLHKGKYGNGVLEIELKNEVRVTNGIPENDLHIAGRITRSQLTLNEDIKNGAKLFIRSVKTLRPTINFYKTEKSIKPPTSLLSKKINPCIPTNTDASSEIKTLFDGVNLMSYPKPVGLIKFLEDCALYEDKNGIILDFFSGSATTAHACMQLNAEDGGNRKFIMVQLPEVCAPDSEAAKAGYKNICEIGKERIRRAGEKIKAEHATTAPNLDIGFRVLKIDESIMKDVFYSPNETSQDLLSTLESNIKEDRTDLDLLFACLVDWGVELSMPLKMESIDGVEIHTMNDGDAPALVACFAQNIPETVVRKIAARHPLRAVFRDTSFADSPAKINLTEIFKTYSPETDVKVL